MLPRLERGDPGGGSLSLARLIDDYGEGLVPDLRFHYGIDVMETVRGRGMSPSLVLMHVQRLPDTSATAALMEGGWDHFGWGLDRYLAARTHDLVATQTGNEVWPRPKRKATTPTKPTRSVKELWHLWNNQ